MDTTIGSVASKGSSVVSKKNVRSAWNKYHRGVKDPLQAARFRSSRELSVKLYGTPNDPVKVQIHDVAGVFQEHIVTNLLSSEDAALLINAFPFARLLLDKRHELPPQPTSDPSVYLHESRIYRLGSPMIDRLTKIPRTSIGADSTYLKFALGIDTRDCLHIGSGKIFASSAPDAKKNVDWLVGNEIFNLTDAEVDEFPIIVSDAAIPNTDGLGCGSYPRLVQWANEQALRGKKIILKLITTDLGLLTIPYHILHKPRRHNFEIIVSINIPGVSLDYEDIEENITSENLWRNDCVFTESIPPLGDEFYETLDLGLLGDDRDYESLLAGYSPQPKATLESLRHMAPIDESPDPNKVSSLIEAGFFVYEPTFNVHAAEKSASQMTIELSKLGKLETKGKGHEYRYLPHDKTLILRKKYRVFKHNPGTIPLPHEYPTAMWIDLFGSYTAESIATHVATLSLLHKNFVQLIQRGNVRTWGSLKKRWKGKKSFENP